jgi:hypothetical protein
MRRFKVALGIGASPENLHSYKHKLNLVDLSALPA